MLLPVVSGGCLVLEIDWALCYTKQKDVRRTIVKPLWVFLIWPRLGILASAPSQR